MPNFNKLGKQHINLCHKVFCTDLGEECPVYTHQMSAASPFLSLTHFNQASESTTPLKQLVKVTKDPHMAKTC